MSLLDIVIISAFAILILISVVGLRVLRNIPKWIWGMLAVSGGVFLLLVRMETMAAVEAEKVRMRKQAGELVASAAADFQRAGHAALKTAGDPGAEDIREFKELMEQWLRIRGEVEAFRTVRLNSTSGVTPVLSVVRGETANPITTFGGSYPGRDEQEIRMVPFVVGAQVEGPVTGNRGPCLRGYCPLRDSSGRVEAVLIGDIDAAGWSAALDQAASVKLMEFQFAGSAVLMILAALLLIHFSMRNATYRRAIAISREEMAKFENLVDSINSIVWECDAKTLRYTFVSKLARKILGYDVKEWQDDPHFRERILHPEDSWAIAYCRRMIQTRKPYEFDYRVVSKDGQVVWLRESGRIIIGEDGEPFVIRGVLQDITTWKEVNEEMERLNRNLMDASRVAGMAEVATSVLHNVGNLLNSISVSSTIVTDRIQSSKVNGLRRTAIMIREKTGSLADFLVNDPKGKLIPEYIDTATRQMSVEHAEVLEELATLNNNLEHVKEIISMQQSITGISGVFEFLHPAALVDEAVRMNADKFRSNRIQAVNKFCLMPPQVKVDRHKVLQILVNLIQNSIQAMETVENQDKRLVFKVTTEDDGTMVAIRVCDNGVGIAPEGMTDIFRYGFTTKKDGHGFGLHSAANFAKEMGGSLTVHSEGPGRGAEFVLLLPTC